MYKHKINISNLLLNATIKKILEKIILIKYISKLL